jgi:glycosyltransferase involved in cell wall biosynthesis
VLLIAEAANPEWVSVPLLGWSNSRALARIADVHLVTQLRNRDAIVRAGLTEGSDFTSINSEALARPVHRLAGMLSGGKGKGWTFGTALSSITYPYFEHLVWREFGSRIRAGEFDLVHRLIPLSPTAPSLLASRCRRVGVPFVLGPLNGGLPWPRSFDKVRRQENEWLSYVRSFYKLLPGYHATRRHASAIIAGSGDVINQMPQKYRDKCVYVPENGIEIDRFPRKRTRQAVYPVRGVFIGRLVPYKGADMLLEAAAPLIRDGKLQLEIIGDGPQMPELQEIVRREGIGDGVSLLGWVDHKQLADHLVDSDLLTFPSIREFGGAVVLEAMTVGVVPVVVDYGGPGELATEETGYLVSLGDRAQIVERLRGVLAGIVADPSQIEPKSRAAMRRVEQSFTWERKAAQILEVYRWVLGQRPTKPDFSMPLRDEPDDHAALPDFAPS